MRRNSPLPDPILLILASIGIIFLLWLPRWPALNRFVMVDEPRWLMRSANFYKALSLNDYRSTFQREHPGVTTMWAGTLGFLSLYPEYTQETNESWANPARLQIFLRNHQHSSIELLEAGRQFMVAAIILVLALAFFPAVKLLGVIPACIGFVLIALDPFSIALSRLLHLDGLVSALMFTSVLWYLVYLRQPTSLVGLIISAITAGLGWLTKSPALFLIPWFALITLFSFLGVHTSSNYPHKNQLSQIYRAIAPYSIWILLACAVFIMLWPSMWVNPLETIQKILVQASDYATEGHTSVTFFNGQVYEAGESPWYFYPLAYLWRSSPFTWVGLILLLCWRFIPGCIRMEPSQKKTLLYLALFSILFSAFISVSAKKFDRYLLPVFAPINIIAAFGYYALFQTLRQRMKSATSYQAYKFSIAIVLVIFIYGQIWIVQRTYPYYINYFNPLLGGSKAALQSIMVGWGEGLEQAAFHLNELPQANKLRVISWYSVGSFSYFFRGTNLGLEFNTSLAELERADYAVIYVHQWQLQAPSKEFLDYFRRLTPVYVVRINDVDYAQVYKLR